MEMRAMPSRDRDIVSRARRAQHRACSAVFARFTEIDEASNLRAVFDMTPHERSDADGPVPYTLRVRRDFATTMPVVAALQMRGGCLIPWIGEGDVAFVTDRPGRTVGSRDLVALKFSSPGYADNEIFIKVMQAFRDDWFLLANERDTPPLMHRPDALDVIGLVVAIAHFARPLAPNLQIEARTARDRLQAKRVGVTFSREYLSTLYS